MTKTGIRMILCDVDGTLLEKGCATISKDVTNAIQYATDNGIHFVIASGRCYSDLCLLFSELKERVTFVASDGGVVVQNGQTLYTSAISKKSVQLLFDSINEGGQMHCVIYTKDDVYTIGSPLCNLPNKAISSLQEVYGNIYKVAFYNLSDSVAYKVTSRANKSMEYLNIYRDSLWIEFVANKTDKGSACRVLQNQFNISPSETVAFGDNVNDYGMLRCAQYTYASSTAVPDIKRMCKFTSANIPNEIMKLSQERGTL